MRGEYWTFNNVTVVPKPYQKPHPLTRVAALSADTFPLIGSMGYPTFLLSGRGIDYLDEQMKEYRRAYKEAGHTGPDDVLLRIPAYVAETAERAYSEPEHSTLHQQAYNARVLAGFQVTEEARQQARARAAVSYDEMIEQRLVFGTSEAVVDRLQEYKERLGLSGFILEVNHGGQIPNERVANSMKLLAERGVPQNQVKLRDRPEREITYSNTPSSLSVWYSSSDRPNRFFSTYSVCCPMRGAGLSRLPGVRDRLNSLRSLA